MQLIYKRARMIAALLSSSQLLPAAGCVAALLLSGHARAQANASPFVSAQRFDAMQRVVGRISPDPDVSGPLHHAATRNTYNAAGWLTKVETGELQAWQPESIAPASWSGFNVFRVVDNDYDAMGRKSRERVSSSSGQIKSLTQYSYDEVGRPICTAVRMNESIFSAAAPTTSACDPGSTGSLGPDRVTKSVYETTGRLAQVRRGVGTDKEQAYVTYTYTGNGMKSDVIDAGGNRAHMTYDGFDRQKQWQFPSATKPASFNGADQSTATSTASAANTGDYEEYGYDLNGNRVSMRKRDGREFTFSFDGLDRLSSKIVPKGDCVSPYVCTHLDNSMMRDVYYGYDNRGLQRFARFDSASGADQVVETYDAVGRHASTLTAMAGIPRSLSYNYDADGDRSQLLFPDTAFDYSYDGMGRMNGASVGGTSLISVTYNARTLPDTVTRGPGNTTYSYDAISRLSSQSDRLTAGAAIVTAGFQYNPASQIVSRDRDTNLLAYANYTNNSQAYVADGLNQYSSVSGTGFSYDSNGNLQTDGSKTYTYDAENRLLSVSGSKNGTLAYDPLGRLYQTTGASGTTRFLYDGDRLTVEYDGSGNMLRRYLHGTTEDTPLVAFEGVSVGSSSAQFLHPDHQGSITFISDNGGAALATNRYDEHGVPAVGNAGRFQFTGQAWLADIALYHYKARVYSPSIGRFLQTDPVGYDDQFNLYAYVANDPVNGRDPTGTRIHVNGGYAEKEELKAAILAAAKSSPALLARYNSMVSSNLVAEIYPIPKGQMPYNSSMPPPPLSNDASNGRGSSTQAGIDLDGTTKGDGMFADAPTQAAHEVLSHGFDAMSGVLNDQVNPNTGVPVSEERGVRGENEYRRATGQPIRETYGGRDITSSGVTKPLPTPNQCNNTTGKVSC